MERMTLQQAGEGQSRSIEGAVTMNGLYGVVRAGRLKPAGWPQQGRDEVLIAANGQYQKLTHVRAI